MEPITRKEKILAGEDLEPITREEWFLKNASGGGGSALPEYTTSDTGKVLTVTSAGVPTETVVAVNESITCEVVEGYGEPIGAITETAILYSLKIGDTITVTVDDDVTYTGVVEDYGEYGIGYYDDTAQSGVSWSVSDEWAYFSYAQSGTYSVKIEASLPVLSEVYNDTLTFDSHYTAIVEPCPVALRNIAIGDLIKLTINGTSIMGRVSDDIDPPSIGIHNDELGMGVLWNTGDDMAMFGNTEVGSYAVKVEAPVPELDAEWNALAPFVVHFSRNGSTYTADKTYSEIRQAMATNVVLFEDGSGMLGIAYGDGIGRAVQAQIVNCNTTGNIMRVTNIYVSYLNAVGLEKHEYTLTPREDQSE